MSHCGLQQPLTTAAAPWLSSSATFSDSLATFPERGTHYSTPNSEGVDSASSQEFGTQQGASSTLVTPIPVRGRLPSEEDIRFKATGCGSAPPSCVLWKNPYECTAPTSTSSTGFEDAVGYDHCVPPASFIGSFLTHTQQQAAALSQKPEGLRASDDSRSASNNKTVANDAGINNAHNTSANTGNTSGIPNDCPNTGSATTFDSVPLLSSIVTQNPYVPQLANSLCQKLHEPQIGKAMLQMPSNCYANVLDLRETQNNRADDGTRVELSSYCVPSSTLLREPPLLSHEARWESRPPQQEPMTFAAKAAGFCSSPDYSLGPSRTHPYQGRQQWESTGLVQALPDTMSGGDIPSMNALIHTSHPQHVVVIQQRETSTEQHASQVMNIPKPNPISQVPTAVVEPRYLSFTVRGPQQHSSTFPLCTSSVLPSHRVPENRDARNSQGGTSLEKMFSTVSSSISATEPRRDVAWNLNTERVSEALSAHAMQQTSGPRARNCEGKTYAFMKTKRVESPVQQNKRARYDGPVTHNNSYGEKSPASYALDLQSFGFRDGQSLSAFTDTQRREVPLTDRGNSRFSVNGLMGVEEECNSLISCEDQNGRRRHLRNQDISAAPGTFYVAQSLPLGVRTTPETQGHWMEETPAILHNTDSGANSAFVQHVVSHMNEHHLGLAPIAFRIPEECAYKFDAKLTITSAAQGQLQSDRPLSARGTAEYVCSFPGVSWNTRMQSWLVYYEDMTGRKSKTFNPKRFSPSLLDRKDPHYERLCHLDKVCIAMHYACAFATEVRYRARLYKSFGFRLSRTANRRHNGNTKKSCRVQEPESECDEKKISTEASDQISIPWRSAKHYDNTTPFGASKELESKDAPLLTTAEPGGTREVSPSSKNPPLDVPSSTNEELCEELMKGKPDGTNGNRELRTEPCLSAACAPEDSAEPEAFNYLHQRNTPTERKDTCNTEERKEPPSEAVSDNDANSGKDKFGKPHAEERVADKDHTVAFDSSVATSEASEGVAQQWQRRFPHQQVGAQTPNHEKYRHIHCVHRTFPEERSIPQAPRPPMVPFPLEPASRSAFSKHNLASSTAALFFKQQRVNTDSCENSSFNKSAELYCAFQNHLQHVREQSFWRSTTSTESVAPSPFRASKRGPKGYTDSLCKTLDVQEKGWPNNLPRPAEYGQQMPHTPLHETQHRIMNIARHGHKTALQQVHITTEPASQREIPPLTTFSVKHSASAGGACAPFRFELLDTQVSMEHSHEVTPPTVSCLSRPPGVLGEERDITGATTTASPGSELSSTVDVSGSSSPSSVSASSGCHSPSPRGLWNLSDAGHTLCLRMDNVWRSSDLVHSGTHATLSHMEDNLFENGARVL